MMRWCRYTSVTPYGLQLEPAHAAQGLELSPETWRQHLGDSAAFPDFYDFFDTEAQRRGLAALLHHYGPLLMPGCVGALFHSIIHLGWGLDAKNHCMTVEGALRIDIYAWCHDAKRGSGSGTFAVCT
jgi:Questin oxidase-like